MAEVITFVNYRPPPRYDALPWTAVRIQEAATQTGTYTLLETIALSPVDGDPTVPQLRSFTTELGTAPEYWYWVVFADATGDTSQPTSPVQNIVGATIPTVSAYGTIAELARRLKIVSPPPTPAQEVALQLALDSAAQEIDWELSGTAAWTPPPTAPPYPPLVVEVNYDRAIEHWRQGESPFGIVASGDIPVVAARDSWYRHGLKLKPLKGLGNVAGDKVFGIA